MSIPSGRESLLQRNHPIVLLMALEGTSMAEDLFKYFQKKQSGENMDKWPPLPSPNKWWRYYRDMGGYLFSTAIKIFPHLAKESSFVQWLSSLSEPLFSRSRPRPKEFAEKVKEKVERELDARAQAQLQENMNAIGGQEAEPDDEAKAEALKGLSMPEMQFLLLVVVPCLAHFQEMPQPIYKRAINGDLEAICMLLRVDPFILLNRNVMVYVQRLSFEKPSHYRANIGKSMAEGLPQMDLREIKLSLGGLLMAMTYNCTNRKLKIHPADIRDLYALLAEPGPGGIMSIYSSLSESNDGLRQALYRAKKKWDDALDVL